MCFDMRSDFAVFPRDPFRCERHPKYYVFPMILGAVATSAARKRVPSILESDLPISIWMTGSRCEQPHLDMAFRIRIWDPISGFGFPHPDMQSHIQIRDPISKYGSPYPDKASYIQTSKSISTDMGSHIHPISRYGIPYPDVGFYIRGYGSPCVDVGFRI